MAEDEGKTAITVTIITTGIADPDAATTRVRE